MHRAIETRYKGRRFRSRLEARYAVLFESLELDWEFEPEGFELGSGIRYLPDFFIKFEAGTECRGQFGPGSGYWVEIKPYEPSEKELRRMMLLIEQTGHEGYIFVGSPDKATYYARDISGKAFRESKTLAHAGPFMVPGSAAEDHDFNACVRRAMSSRFEFGESGDHA